MSICGSIFRGVGEVVQSFAYVSGAPAQCPDELSRTHSLNHGYLTVSFSPDFLLRVAFVLGKPSEMAQTKICQLHFAEMKRAVLLPYNENVGRFNILMPATRLVRYPEAYNVDYTLDLDLPLHLFFLYTCAAGLVFLDVVY